MTGDSEGYTARMKYMADGRDKLGRTWMHGYTVVSPDGEDTGIEYRVSGGARREETREFIWNGTGFGSFREVLAAKEGVA